MVILMKRYMERIWELMNDEKTKHFVPMYDEMTPKGVMSPIEYSTPFIKDMIISARKQSLVTSLEHDLLEDARVNGQFIIIE